MKHLILLGFFGMGAGIGCTLTIAWLLQYFKEAQRYRFLRDQPASIAPNPSIRNWMLQRPFSASELDAIVDSGIVHAHHAPEEAVA